MDKTNSLKQYYVSLQKLYSNAVNILTAINQSLNTSSSEITVTIADTDDTVQSIRIPSFLYLENKLEQLDTNFSELFNMPKSGEAWFENKDNMFKLHLVKANTAPIEPTLSDDTIYALTKDNNILKDLVCPKTYLKANISNLPENIEEVCMKKFIFYDASTYQSIKSSGISTYEEYKSALYTLKKGVDYDEYDGTLKMPLKNDEFISSFKILEIPELESSNPWQNTDDSGAAKTQYKIMLDTIKYTDKDDSSITYDLTIGDFISLSDENAIYKIKNISTNSNDGEQEYYAIIEEYVGHIALQTYDENQNMVFKKYISNYNKFHYVEIPLEENEYIAVFLSTIYDNVRSTWSNAILLDLATIEMKDQYGQKIYNENGNAITYIDYYNKYCKNIGDLISGLSSTAYPQITNYSSANLYDMQEGSAVQSLVSTTIDNSSILTVTKINSHILNDETTQNVISLHEKKSDINAQLTSVQDNIDQVYNQLTTTDFTTETSITQNSLRSKLTDYYNERISLQKQLISIIENINTYKADVKASTDSKYRIRGIAVTDNLESYLHTNFADKCDLIGIDVEYKYKSASNTTTSVSTINSAVFSDWNKLETIDKQRKLVFNTSTNEYTIEYENYNSDTNIIKWDQIDIPINQGEDVVIRVRYKYSIGQPFFNLYTPWSDEITMSFPSEYETVTEISTILETNADDTTSAKFSKTLISEGYQEHINNKILDNSQVYYHMPENIYSGFNTPENKLISLKDKLTSIVNDVDECKDLIGKKLSSEYKVYLEWDTNNIELSSNTDNAIYLNESMSESNDTFIKKKMNIVFKNTGSTTIDFYSIFPGNTAKELIMTDIEHYNKYISNYERVPILIGNITEPSENINFQTLGQWIYFRENDPYTLADLYYNNSTSNNNDYISAESNTGKTTNISYLPLSLKAKNCISENNMQMLLGYRDRTSTYNRNASILSYDSSTSSFSYTNTTSSNIYDFLNSSSAFGDDSVWQKPADWFKYKSIYDKDNNFLLKYEHVRGIASNKDVYLGDTNFSIKKFVSTYSPANMTESDFSGAFFIPELSARSQILCNTENNAEQSIKLSAGNSISIPIIYEYYLDGSSTSKKITKTICFDIKPSLVEDPKHYIVSITANYDFSSSNMVFTTAKSAFIDA